MNDEIAAQSELDVIDAEVKAIIEDAHTFAQDSPWPDSNTVADHVYSFV